MSQASSAAGRAAELLRFRRLVETTAAATFVLIVVGGIVRVSDSGLGCATEGTGTKGWPLCGGRVLPFIDQSAIIEFAHRALATIVVVLIALCAIHAYRHLREMRWPLRGSIVAAATVLFQAGLGGLTVDNNLHETLVAAHLCMAMLLLATLLYLDSRTRREQGLLPAVPSLPRGIRPLAAIAAITLLAAIVAGGYVAGTEGEGAEGKPVVAGAHTACGEQFPRCLGEFLPFGETRLADIQLTHRVLVYLATILIVALLIALLLAGVRSWLLGAAGALLVSQVFLGALNVWAGKHASLIVAHLTTATLLWSSIVLIGMYFAWAPATAKVPKRRAGAKAEASAATA